jgi:thioredoxin 1
MIAPVFEEMSSEFESSCDFVKVDVDQIPELTERYQVMSMPTFLFIKNGEVVERFSGASVEKLRETINSLI